MQMRPRRGQSGKGRECQFQADSRASTRKPHHLQRAPRFSAPRCRAVGALTEGACGLRGDEQASYWLHVFYHAIEHSSAHMEPEKLAGWLYRWADAVAVGEDVRAA